MNDLIGRNLIYNQNNVAAHMERIYNTSMFCTLQARKAFFGTDISNIRFLSFFVCPNMWAGHSSFFCPWRVCVLFAVRHSVLEFKQAVDTVEWYTLPLWKKSHFLFQAFINIMVWNYCVTQWGRIMGPFGLVIKRNCMSYGLTIS